MIVWLINKGGKLLSRPFPIKLDRTSRHITPHYRTQLKSANLHCANRPPSPRPCPLLLEAANNTEKPKYWFNVVSKWMAGEPIDDGDKTLPWLHAGSPVWLRLFVWAFPLAYWNQTGIHTLIELGWGGFLAKSPHSQFIGLPGGSCEGNILKRTATYW